LLCLAILAMSAGIVLASNNHSPMPAVNRPAVHGPVAAPAVHGPVAAPAVNGPVATPADGGPSTGIRPAPIIYRPPGLSRAKPVALVIALHASGGTPASFEAKSQWDTVANRRGFVVAYLGSAAPAWKDPSNVSYISSMIDQIKASQNIDPRRVYVTGFSAGAYISFFVGCELSNKVAAIAPISDGMLPQPCHLVRPLSELLIIGTSDILPLSGNAIFPPVASMEARWRGLDNCPAESPRTSHVGPVQQQIWGSCADHSAVALYIINGGQHVYPGSAGLPASNPDAQYNATNAVWAFFAAHTAGSLAHPSATLSGLHVGQSGSQRSLTATLGLQEGVSVLASVTSANRTLAARTFTLRSGGRTAVQLPVPSTAKPGRYTARLRIRDAYGRSVTLSRSFRLS
jgi:polyhydroxybutyrate depolymerase